jgi:uncharacterized protein (TIGR02145 family)
MKNWKLIYPVLLMGLSLFLANSCKKDDSSNSSDNVTDVDGNVYHTITIGSQTWMVENLKVTHYNDGINDPITYDTAGGLTTPAYCWYNDDITNKNKYGALYNGYAATSLKLCPVGWHVPYDSEWATLISNLGGDSTLVGGYLKESGSDHWLAPNTGTNSNSSGFKALPGGCRLTDGTFKLINYCGWFWSSTTSSSSPTAAWHEYMKYNSQAIYRTTGSKSLGFSVRCIKGGPSAK